MNDHNLQTTLLQLTHGVLVAVTMLISCESAQQRTAMDKNESKQTEESKASMQKYEVSISQAEPASWSQQAIPVQVMIANASDSSGEFHRSSLLGITINGVESSYNLNLHFDYLPGEGIRIPAHARDTFLMNLKDRWHDPQPRPGRYRIVLRFEIEKIVYPSNELIIDLAP